MLDATRLTIPVKVITVNLFLVNVGDGKLARTNQLGSVTELLGRPENNCSLLGYKFYYQNEISSFI